MNNPSKEELESGAKRLLYLCKTEFDRISTPYIGSLVKYRETNSEWSDDSWMFMIGRMETCVLVTGPRVILDGTHPISLYMSGQWEHQTCYNTLLTTSSYYGSMSPERWVQDQVYQVLSSIQDKSGMHSSVFNFFGFHKTLALNELELVTPTEALAMFTNVLGKLS